MEKITKADLEVMYEWYLALNKLWPDMSLCSECCNVGKKLSRKLGPDARKIRKLVKDHPYGKD